MKKIIFMIALLLMSAFLATSRVLAFTVQTNGGGIEVHTDNPNPAPAPQVVVVHPSTPQVVVEKTTVVQPKGSFGCDLQPNRGRSL